MTRRPPSVWLHPYRERQDEAWKDHARCVDTAVDFWFPGRGATNLVEQRKFCAPCPVREQCLEYALEHNIKFGVWGGLSERERRRLALRRKPQ